MPEIRAAIVINPVSGRHGRRDPGACRRIDRARASARAASVAAEIVLTRGPGDARTLAAQFVDAGIGRVVVWGGDGTINEAAGPLVGTPVVLGIVAGGSGDGLARGLGLPREPAEALRVALRGPSSAVDVGYLGDRHFLNIGGIGFDAAVAVRFNRRHRRGTRGYVIDAIRAVWSYQCEPLEVATDGERVSGPHFLVAFANGREYGSGLVLAPVASPTDGWLDLIRVEGGGPWRQCWRARRLLVRRMKPAEGIIRARIRAATVTGARLACHVDGESFEARGSIDVCVRPAAISVAGAAG